MSEKKTVKMSFWEGKKNEKNTNYILCVVDLVEVAAGVVGREDAGLAGPAGVAVTVAGVDGVEADVVVVAGVAGVEVATPWPAAFCCAAAVDTVSTTRMRMQALGP